MVFTAHAGMVDEIMEEGAYKILEEGIRASGKSEEQAKCIVMMLRASGATKDVTDVRNILQPRELAQKLKEKAQAANFLCTYGTAIWIGAALVLLFTCCLCCCLCSQSTPKPTVVHIAMPQHPSKGGSYV
jgi:hypothetical protein